MPMLSIINYYDTKSVSFHTTMYSDRVKTKDITYSQMHIKYLKPEKDSLKCLVPHSFTMFFSTRNKMEFLVSEVLL